MKRSFLETPEAWTRAARTAQTTVDAAYAIQRLEDRPAAVQPHEWVILALVGAVVAGIALGVM